VHISATLLSFKCKVARHITGPGHKSQNDRVEKRGPLMGQGAGEAGTAFLAGFARGTEGVVGAARLIFSAKTIRRTSLLPPNVDLLWVF